MSVLYLWFYNKTTFRKKEVSEVFYFSSMFMGPHSMLSVSV